MSQPNGYPKIFWVLTRAEVIVEDNKEVVNHCSDQIIGGTFDGMVAEKMAAILKQHENLSTMIYSNVNPTPIALLDALPSQEDENIQSLLDLVELP